MLVHSSPVKSRNWLAHVFDAFATHGSLVFDISVQVLGTDNRMAVLAVMVSDFQTLSFNKQDEKLMETLECVQFKNSVSFDVACGASSSLFPFICMMFGNFSSFWTVIRLKAHEHVFAKQEALCFFSFLSVYIITEKILFNSKVHKTSGCFTVVT